MVTRFFLAGLGILVLGQAANGIFTLIKNILKKIMYL